MTTPRLSPDTIQRLKRAVYPSYALLAAVQLGIFTPLRGGSMTAEEIAVAIGADPDKLRALLYSLVPTGLLAVEDGRFSNSPEADHFLVRGGSEYAGLDYEVFATGRWNDVLKTADSVRTGSAAARVDFSSMSEDDLETFYQTSYQDSMGNGRELVARYDFSAYRSLIDVGGGSGGLSITVVKECPHLRATIVDFPTVVPVAQRFVNESGVADRMSVVAGDVANQPLSGVYDVAILSNFIPVVSPNDILLTLKNVFQVLEPGGVLYVRDLGTLNDDRLSPAGVALGNLSFINIFEEGQARTEGERRKWLATAGFADVERDILPSGHSIMRATKPG
ncbi:MAG: methyltransferase [Chloroflexi bacterium]|nr:methyltransferase [Chloroflexota bacterium]